jgi:hypothetical protein
MCSVTSERHAGAIFRRALERRNLIAAWAAAAELPFVSLADAPSLCLLVREREPARFARFALRWHARFCAETHQVGLEDGRLVLDLLAVCRRSRAGRGRPRAARAAGELRRGLAEPLRRWEPPSR